MQVIANFFPSCPTHRFNYHGFLASNKHSDTEAATNYVQIFRNGMVDRLFTLNTRQQTNQFWIGWAEQQIILTIELFLNLQKFLSADSPFIIFISVMNVKGYTFAFDDILKNDLGHPIEHPLLLMPEIYIEDYSTDYKSQFKQIFDTIWNAAGWSEAQSIDKTGNWKKIN